VDVATIPTATTAPARKEIRALTGLRAVAATWVVLFHFKDQVAPYTDQVPFARALLDAGWIGVELFFVLSGFVIARSYLEELGRRWRTREAARFLFNRFARVWPAYAVVTVIAFVWLIGAKAVGLDSDVNAAHPSTDLVNLLRQLTMTQMWDQDNFVGISFNPPGWSVSAEWAAYLAFPLLALLLRPFGRLHPLANLALATLAMAPLVLPAFQHGPLALHWSLRITCCFVAGVLASLAVKDLETRDRVEDWGPRLTVGSLIGVLLVCVWAEWRRGGNYGVDFAGVAVLFFPLLVVGLTLGERGPARLLARDALVYGGRISYCLYLTHFVVQDMAYTVLWRNPDVARVLTPTLVLVVPGIILAAFVTAAALHHGVEEPARRQLLALWKRFEGDRQRAGAAAPRARRPAVVPANLPEPRTERLSMNANRRSSADEAASAEPAGRAFVPRPSPAVDRPRERAAEPARASGTATVGPWS
jgi:peptidoglycan/LPS O-acetylase OafA/YrhL